MIAIGRESIVHLRRICELTRRLVLGPLILSVLTASLLASCDDTYTDWTIQVPSPDSAWVATTKSQYGAGPGTAWAGTDVYLGQAHQRPTEILGFNERFVHLDIKWLTPSHLEITYQQRAPEDTLKPAYQVVRYAGLDISFKSVPNSQPPRSGAQSPR
jgi:hypothetical protein